MTEWCHRLARGRVSLTSWSSCAVVLRVLELSDTADLLALRVRNRRYFRPTEPLRDDDWFTLQHQRSELQAETDARAAGRSLTFGVFADDVLAGRLGACRRSRGGVGGERV
jgi:ribosomal-protein-alanine N-acetyltransferase